jgi:hypothetical protein
LAGAGGGDAHRQQGLEEAAEPGQERRETGCMFGKSEAGVGEKKVAKLVVMELRTIVGTVRGR